MFNKGDDADADVGLVVDANEKKEVSKVEEMFIKEDG